MKKKNLYIISKLYASFLILALFPVNEIFAQKAEVLNSQNDSILKESKMIDVAYGKQSYDGVTSSMSTVYSKDLNKVTAVTVDDALIGRLPGLTLQQSSGEPGAGMGIYIRGRNTYNGSGPLVIVDGFRSDYDQLSIYEIKSISILKDASAVALYGQEAANGVLLVTTKRGEIGETKIEVNANFGVQQISKKPDLLNAKDYATLYNQARENDGLYEKYSATDDIPNYGKGGVYQFTHPDNDYFDECMSSLASVATAGMNISGGSDALRYMVTFGYMHNGGMYKNTDENDAYSTQAFRNKYNLRTNLDVKILDNLTAQIDIGGYLDNRHYPGIAAGNILSAIYSTPPQEYPIINPDGSLGGSASYTDNPYGLITSKGYQTLLSRNLDMTLHLKYDMGNIVKGLALGIAGSSQNYMRLWDNKTKNFATYSIDYAPDPEDYDPSIPDAFAYTMHNDDTELNWVTAAYSSRRMNFEANASYDRTFGDHSFQGLLMYHLDRYETSDNYYKFSNAGFGFRGHYGYKSKYFAEFTAGYYGQEQYKSGHRFGFFPAGAVAWIASKEDFLKDNNSVNYLKLRLSYGIAGGEAFGGTTVHNRIYYNQYYSGAANSYFGTTNQTAYMGRVEGIMANPDISWDKSYKTDLSVEGTFFNHIKMMFDYFYDRRTDILSYDNKVLGTIGLNGGYNNGGEVKNKGYEATLSFFDNTGDFQYSINTGIWYNHSEIVKNPSATIYQNDYRSSIGKPVGQNFGYVTNGFYDAASVANMTVIPSFGDVQEGDTKYEDLNGDNVINDDDVTSLGYTGIPEYTYTLGLDLKYKKISLSLMGQGTMHSSYMLGGYYIPFATQGNAFEYAKDSWTSATASTAKYPRLSSVQNSNNNQGSKIWLLSGDYFRLRNVELGYDLPVEWASSLHFANMKVFVHGQNLFTWAKDIDFTDPETLMNYPALKSYTLGINLSF